MFAYNLTKYHIVLLKKYLTQLSPQNYSDKYKSLKLAWNEYFTLPEFNIHKKNVASKLSRAEMTFLELYQKCQHKIAELTALNEYFEDPFSSSIRSEDEWN